ncbi:MAG: hypothetical protein R2729_27055 [Bryobacteraceae bacterium]
MNFRRILAASLAVAPLCAGVRIVSETKEQASGAVMNQEMLIEDTRIRMNIKGKQNMSILFLTAGGNRLVMVDNNRNEFREIDQATMDQMANQVQGMMSAMEEKLKAMPPDQRAMIEKMMKGKMGGAPAAAPAKTVYAAKGSATMNGFRCTQYEGTRNGQKVSEMCAAAPNAVSMDPGAYQVFGKMREFIAGFARMSANSPLAPKGIETMAEPDIKGLPVHHVAFANGQPVTTTDVKSVNKASFSDADFSTGNARKMEMPTMGGGRRSKR